ncbi:MAG: SpoIIE family protein phosphatase, partial [candidate division Zixibacteria bacterium]|nr:SpoIIE family protein phosphatase [candidate division Zixibacteria bacterium]
ERDLEWSGGLSLRMKFSAGTLLIILILLAGSYYYINSRSTSYIYSQLDKTVDALCNTIASQAYGYIINDRSDAEFDELVVSYQRANDILNSIVIVGAEGEVLADSRGPGRLHTPYDPQQLRRFMDAGQSARFDVATTAPVMVRRIDHGGSTVGVVIMQYSTVTIGEELTHSRRIILIITGIGLLIGIAGIYLLSNYFVRPIGRIVNRVRKFSQGDLDSQLPLEGAEEFYEISKALNELIMRIRRDRKNIVEREILHKEMQLAEEIQKALIPRQLPTIHGFDIGTIYKAARMVGGDLFDFVKIDDETFGVVVADVSGKGVPGSLVMTMVRTALKLEAKGNRSARDILVRLNDYVVDDIKRGMFVTILLAVIDIRTRKVNFASAGHNPIIHYVSRDHEALFLNAKGMPVGIKTDRAEFAAGLEEAVINLAPEDFLVIYTDGVTEGRGDQQRAYGTDRVIDIVRENQDRTAGEIASAIEDDIVRFIGKHDQHDDITMVILKNCPTSQETGQETADSDAQENSHRVKIDSIVVDPPRDREPEM